jgi:hypothetical protein
LLLLLGALGCGARSEIPDPRSSSATSGDGGLPPQAVTVYNNCSITEPVFFFTLWARDSPVGCCPPGSCNVASAGPGNIMIGNVPDYVAQNLGTFPVGGASGSGSPTYCVATSPGNIDCVNATGTLTLTTFDPASGDIAGSYSLMVDGTGMALSDVFAGTICPLGSC